MSQLISYYCGAPGRTGATGATGQTGQAGATGQTGATGDNGSVTTYGSFDPRKRVSGEVNGIPQHIDQYFNLWWYVGGQWNKIGNIIGPDGNKGKTGDKGKKGHQGQTGQTGDIGPIGCCRLGNNINSVMITNNGTHSLTPVILFPYLNQPDGCYLHTLKVSYRIHYKNESDSISSFSIAVHNQDSIITRITNNVLPRSEGYLSNLDMVSGLKSKYYYVSWMVDNPNLYLTLNNGNCSIYLRTIY